MEAQATQISTKGSPNILPEICGELEAQAVQISTKGSPNILSEIREELEAQAVQIPRKGLSPLYHSIVPTASTLLAKSVTTGIIPKNGVCRLVVPQR